jgi:hypothetical protein
MENAVDVKPKEQDEIQRPDRTVAAPGRESNGACIEYLQRAIVRSLMRDQAIRFELPAANGRIGWRMATG